MSHTHSKGTARPTGKKSDFASFYTFIRHWIASPKKTGAACPSSRRLARQMASFVPVSSTGIVVELGAGTGAVTAALLEGGISQDRIMVVECSPIMVGFLRERFPGLTVICGDACFLMDLLREHLGGEPTGVGAVVSSLPLRSLPKTMVESIVKQVDCLLGEQGCYIQFTYDLRPGTPCLISGFQRHASKIIWPNIPPARVDLFRRKSPKT